MVIEYIFSKDTHYFYIMMSISGKNIKFCEKYVGNSVVRIKKAHFSRGKCALLYVK